MAAKSKTGTTRPIQRKNISTVDSYKADYGSDCFYGFWDTSSLTKKIVEMPTDLHTMILDAVNQLNVIYIPFAWTWVKDRRPKIMEQVIDLEAEIIVAVQCNDKDFLRSALDKYYDVWLEAIIEFSTQEKYTPF